MSGSPERVGEPVPAIRPGPVLLVEDTRSLQMVYASVLRGAGHQVLIASSAAEAEALFHAERPPVVLLDLVLPDRDGLSLMRELLDIQPDARVIVITANGSINRAVEAMRAGAHEFLVKPFDEQRLLQVVGNARTQPRSPARPTVSSPDVTDSVVDVDLGFIGSSPAIAGARSTIRAAARSTATVFITGESGTGKELAALAIHALSSRADGPFIALNCAAIPQDMLESEVFGHLKGSFSGAFGDKPGAAAAANEGTLFLDEICEMDPALQTKLLRFLQTSTIQAIGAARSRKVNVRIVCATNRDPLAAVRSGTFREDLYYRLHVIPIHMPPLRDRDDDVIEIAEAALRCFAEEEGRRFDGLTPEVTALFRTLPWPGNVRQLLNVIRTVVVLQEGGRVTPAMLPQMLVGTADLPRADRLPLPAVPAPATALDGLIGLTLAQIERRVIEATLAHHNGSVPRAARTLDVSPSTLYRKIEGWARG